MPSQFEHAAGAKPYDDATFGMILDRLAGMETIVLEVIHPARQDVQHEIFLLPFEIGKSTVGKFNEIKIGRRGCFRIQALDAFDPVKTPDLLLPGSRIRAD